MEQMNASRVLELLTVLVPDLNYIEADTMCSVRPVHNLRGDAYADNLIIAGRGGLLQHRTEDVGLVVVSPLLGATAERVGPAADILIVLPQGRNRVAHTEEHPPLELIPQLLKDRQRLAQRLHFCDELECIQRPSLLPWRMVI